MYYNFFEDVELNSDPDQVKRQKSACNKKLTPINIDTETHVGYFKGSAKKPYNTSTYSCTCGDFIRRKLPCKHMYRLAHELHIFKLQDTIEESTIVPINSNGNKTEFLNKETGEIESHISLDGAKNIIASLNQNLIEEIHTLLHLYLYENQEYFFFIDMDKSLCEEIIKTSIFLPVQMNPVEKFNYANKKLMLNFINMINKEKTKSLNSRSIESIIRKFITKNLIDEINFYKEYIYLLKPNPYLKEDFTKIKRFIYNEFINKFNNFGYVFKNPKPSYLDKWRHIHDRDSQKYFKDQSFNTTILLLDTDKVLAYFLDDFACIHLTTLEDCTCDLFKDTFTPCEHMYRLLYEMEYGSIENGFLSPPINKKCIEILISLPNSSVNKFLSIFNSLKNEEFYYSTKKKDIKILLESELIIRIKEKNYSELLTLHTKSEIVDDLIKNGFINFAKSWSKVKIIEWTVSNHLTYLKEKYKSVHKFQINDKMLLKT